MLNNVFCKKVNEQPDDMYRVPEPLQNVFSVHVISSTTLSILSSSQEPFSHIFAMIQTVVILVVIFTFFAAVDQGYP
jgi:hypothetical protein